MASSRFPLLHPKWMEIRRGLFRSAPFSHKGTGKGVPARSTATGVPNLRIFPATRERGGGGKY